MKISQYDHLALQYDHLALQYYHLALVIDKYQYPALGATENHDNSKIILSSELLKKKIKTARVILKKNVESR